MKRKPPCWLLMFWLVCAAIFIFRIGFDLQTYFFGSTIVVRKLSLYQFDHLLHLPRGYHDFGKRPLIIFLHGAGETGKDVRVLKELDIVHYAKNAVPPKDFPFIVVSPITPKHGWDSKRVVAFLDEFLADNRFRYNIDTSRIYLTGFSMGGFGTFQTACDFPDRFAAIVPLAGGGDPAKAANLRTVPTWAFHGDADNVVDYEQSQNMINAIKEAKQNEKLHDDDKKNSTQRSQHNNISMQHDSDASLKAQSVDIRLTTLHNADHGIPEMVYTKPELYQWLLEQKISTQQTSQKKTANE